MHWAPLPRKLFRSWHGRPGNEHQRGVDIDMGILARTLHQEMRVNRPAFPLTGLRQAAVVLGCEECPDGNLSGVSVRSWLRR
jgi:hypothetical protein